LVEAELGIAEWTVTGTTSLPASRFVRGLATGAGTRAVRARTSVVRVCIRAVRARAALALVFDPSAGVSWSATGVLWSVTADELQYYV
jgi:hypothetical protein